MYIPRYLGSYYAAAYCVAARCPWLLVHTYLSRYLKDNPWMIDNIDVRWVGGRQLFLPNADCILKLLGSSEFVHLVRVRVGGGGVITVGKFDNVIVIELG